jgi:hypothetical protein
MTLEEVVKIQWLAKIPRKGKLQKHESKVFRESFSWMGRTSALRPNRSEEVTQAHILKFPF